MTLELVDHRAPAAEKRSWTPFPSSDGYEHPDWWSSAKGAVGDPWFVQVMEDGVEVARVQLDERGGINPEYAGAPAIDSDELLEIQNIEVRTTARRRRVATRALQALAERHPERRLMAYSKGAGADDFWNSLGWEAFYYSQRGLTGGILFIQPPTLEP
ncbi:GNAT family N-acetyltransferase [Mycolicibacterium nivoides]|uniref:GNAT family N-acetyltransferase n=1 Tax=Mycolicibacterium nivoides TaxID=2487344 RepID=UPI000F5BCE81|nr:GNAT family N-acetyltransferase [Mycolicibacterium nivoides]